MLGVFVFVASVIVGVIVTGSSVLMLIALIDHTSDVVAMAVAVDNESAGWNKSRQRPDENPQAVQAIPKIIR